MPGIVVSFILAGPILLFFPCFHLPDAGAGWTCIWFSSRPRVYDYAERKLRHIPFGQFANSRPGRISWGVGESEILKGINFTRRCRDSIGLRGPR